MKNLSRQLLSLVLPTTALIIVPYFIESSLNLTLDLLFLMGLAFGLAGLTILSITVAMLIRRGKGTLAPWAPTSTLVISGVYSYVRNPMITGVMTVLLGEALIFHSTRILIWLILFFIINSVYFMLSEEPGLEKRFGNDYTEYKRNVPRWIPRTTPWKPAEKNS